MSTPAGEQVTVVTGGGAGIGAAVAARYARAGGMIAILDVDEAGGARQVAAIAATGGHARFFSCDVSDAKQVDAVAARVVRELGPPRHLVTCAAIIPDTDSAMTMDLDLHDRMWRVNYHGTLHACRTFGAEMVRRRQGAIVTLSSINTYLALPLPAYNPGKVAIARLTQLLAAELGRHRITVNSVAPTFVMMPALRQRVAEGRRDLDKIMSVHALPELPTPEDIAEAIFFLTSPQARTITGAVLPVDAGWSASVGYMTYAGGVPWSQLDTGGFLEATGHGT